MKKLVSYMMIISFIVIVCSVSANAAIVDSGMCGENVSWVFDDSGCLTISGTGAMENYENDRDQPWYAYKYPGLNTAIQKLVIEEGITRIGNNAFRYCGQILEVSLPNTLEEIGDYAFYQVSQLPEINFPSSLRIIGANAFGKCFGLTKIDIPYGVEKVGSAAFSGIGNALKEVTIAGSVKYIEGSAFSNNYELETVTLNEGTEWIGASAFYMCEAIKEISIPQSVKEIGQRAFQGCDTLEKISFSGGAYIDESAFDVGSTSETPTGCDVYIPNMQVWYDMSFANAKANPLYADGRLFVNGALLTELVVPSDVSAIGQYQFANCAALKSVTLENGIAEICDGAFGGCDDLEKITVPESVASVGKNAFAKSTKLTVYGTPFSAAEAYCTINSVPFVGAASEDIVSSGTCGDSLVWALDDEGTLTVYGAEAMYDYNFADPAPWDSSKESIKSVIIKPGVTYIGKCAFENCANIETITIPKSVASIGGNAFRGCTSLTDVYYNGSETQWNSVSIKSGNDAVKNATWHYAEEEKIEYSFAQSVQIGLIEPWFLKANARVYTDEHPTNINYSELRDFGAYFIRASELDDPDATQTSLAVEDIIENSAAVKYSKKDGTATVDGSYITASYDKGLYTYEMGDSIFVLFYIEDVSGIQYLPIRERNMKELLEKRKNDTENFANALERNVYTAMDKLELDIGAYRAQFAKIEELPKQAAPMLSEYVEKNGAFEDETIKRYTFKNSVQLILVEPWGLKVNSRVFDDANPININYDSVEEFGAIIYYDTEGNVDSMTAEELRTKSDAYVFSSKNGDAAVDGSYITALYNKDIFTYQLDSNAYVMFYIKDADGYHYGDVKIRNAYELAKERAQDTSGNFGEKEKTVYQDMVAMYEVVKAYRDDYFGNN